MKPLALFVFCVVLSQACSSLVTADENVSNLDWWSLREPVRPPVPALAPPESALARTPIDAFILTKLRDKGMSLSPAANPRVLIRRLYFDLLGLPPSPAEIERFVADFSEDAYERLVDRLLGSPHYGERWGRHWLDVVHYGDTHGYDKDKLRENAWPYRDYVVRAFNQDRPYGRFVSEQIAGDVLFPGEVDGIVAMGFIAAGPWDFIGHREVPETKIDGRIARNLDRDDMVRTTLSSFLSMTVGCARCHDHKFDPVTMEDYYSLQSVFAALDRSDRPYGDSPEVAARRQNLVARRVSANLAIASIKVEARERAGESYKALTKELVDLIRAGESNDSPEVKEKRRQREELQERFTEPAQKAKRDAAKEELRKVAKEFGEILPTTKYVYAGTIHHGSGNFLGTGRRGGKPREIRILARGQVTEPGELVGPGTVDIIAGVPSRFRLPESHSESERRKALVSWIVDRRNPLTWRSIVNRVWQYHFGEGIVDTPNDLGRMGGRPSHPELLDWLATTFRDGGQSLKRLHRMIVTSAVYRQVSEHNPRNAAVDGSNRTLWRMNRRRLEGEAVRDAVLDVSGRLDRRPGGPGFRCFVLEKTEHSPHYQYHKHDPDDSRTHRRSVYRFIVRSQPDPFMQTLDCADSSQLVAKRSETLTALQSLALLNNDFMLTMAGHFATRLERLSSEPRERIRWAYRLAVGRQASTEEVADLESYAEEFGLVNACRVIFNLNEFVFVD